ncbi:MAG: efflux RND transporter periplasmic adaptor subunit, partial [Syntrophaceae bacterium]|nr:efflux RND transporter periplasmic adaptor subunit [Syntrophaceae bacterium]
MKKKLFIFLTLLVVLAAAAALGYSYMQRNNKAVSFRTVAASRGDLRAMVTATGTVSAVTTVQVGTQVSGTVKELFVDFNSRVKKGQILARIDPALSEARVAQAKANLQAAVANVGRAEASLLDANRTLERNKTLFAGNYIARSDLDAADTAWAVARAQLIAAEAAVEQQKASLNQEETNLSYTQILSPVNGIVISRSVDIGQTVAASFQTPTLFSIAEDLTRMQIETNVDEADIGQVQVEQAVQFTVDAYPEMTFSGRVSEVRNAPATMSSVVTYGVIVRVANPELKLKPGMTANVSIITAEEKNVLKIPNASLRFKWQSATGTDSEPQVEGTRRERGGGEDRPPSGRAESGTRPDRGQESGGRPRIAGASPGESPAEGTRRERGAGGDDRPPSGRVGAGARPDRGQESGGRPQSAPASAGTPQ